MLANRFDKILDDFVKMVSTWSGVSMHQVRLGSQKTKNVFEMAGPFDYLLYVKCRSQEPLRWGVTANVLDRLKIQSKPWAVVLLYGSSETGYLIPSADVEQYVQNVWPLGSDGDFKVNPGSYLARNTPFHSSNELFDQLSSWRKRLSRETDRSTT